MLMGKNTGKEGERSIKKGLRYTSYASELTPAAGLSRLNQMNETDGRTRWDTLWVVVGISGK